jgi:hypothetical protein
MKNTVAMEASRILTILFPMRTVDSSLSYFSDRASVLAALLLPFSDRVLSLVLLSDEKAVSVAEKYEDIKTRSAITMMVIMSPESIMILSLLEI